MVLVVSVGAYYVSTTWSQGPSTQGNTQSTTPTTSTTSSPSTATGQNGPYSVQVYKIADEGEWAVYLNTTYSGSGSWHVNPADFRLVSNTFQVYPATGGSLSNITLLSGDRDIGVIYFSLPRTEVPSKLEYFTGEVQLEVTNLPAPTFSGENNCFATWTSINCISNSSIAIVSAVVHPNTTTGVATITIKNNGGSSFSTATLIVTITGAGTVTPSPSTLTLSPGSQAVITCTGTTTLTAGSTVSVSITLDSATETIQVVVGST